MGVRKEDPAVSTAAFAAEPSVVEDIQVKGYCARWRKQMAALLYKTGMMV